MPSLTFPVWGCPPAQLPKVGPSGHSGLICTYTKPLLGQKRLHPDLSCSSAPCHWPPLQKLGVPLISLAGLVSEHCGTHLHSSKWFLSFISACEMKSLTLFHRRDRRPRSAVPSGFGFPVQGPWEGFWGYPMLFCATCWLCLHCWDLFPCSIQLWFPKHLSPVSGCFSILGCS